MPHTPNPLEPLFRAETIGDVRKFLSAGDAAVARATLEILGGGTPCNAA